VIFNSVSLIEKIYICAALLTAIESYLLAFFVYVKNRKGSINRSYSLMGLFIGSWSLLLFLCHLSSDGTRALILNRWLHFSSIFIAITFYYFTLNLLHIKKRKLLILGLLCAVILGGLSVFTSEIVIGMAPKFDFRIWPTPGKFYQAYLLYFSFFSYYSLFLIYQGFISSTGNKRSQLRYIFAALFIGFAGGSTNFAYFYNIPISPVGNIFVFLYVLILAYAIVKYRLMDISIVFTRAGIFLALYSLILGIPLWVGLKILGKGLWLIPMSLMATFAMVGPFIYLFIQRRAEEKLLQEQRSYHATLRQASAGMGRIKDLDKLLNMIVFILTRTVRMEHSFIYIFDELKKNYRLGAFKHRSNQITFPEILNFDVVMITYLNNNHNAIVYEEVKHRIQDYHDNQLISIEKTMNELQAALIVPIYIDNRLIGFVGMGKKESGKAYTEDDLSVFSILSNQAALAIENAEFYEDMKVTQQQLFQAEKMATIGIMADGLSHQVNNRFHAMGFIAGDALDTIKMNKNLEMSDKQKEIMAELENALNRIQENVTQGGEVVQGLLKYTRKGEEGFSAVDVDKVVSSAYEMAQFKIKAYQMSLIRDYDKDLLPKVKGNSTQLQEVFFNLIDNAYDAMMQRKNDLKEPEYHPQLTIHAQQIGNSLEMIFSDNGIGVKEEDVQKLFTPFFTTKLSSKKGTGLGLYVIRKIIEDNHRGTVEFSSNYMKGTQMRIRLPLFIDKS
jgi:two-component system NtrC family sensor kinase